MTIVLTIIHVLVCLFLILVVLAQQGKGQDLASAFGGGGSATAFGARGTATLLSKITTVAAVIFMLTSLTLTYLRPHAADSTVVPDTPPPATAPAPSGTEQPPKTPPPETQPSGQATSPAGEPKAEAEKPTEQKPAPAPKPPEKKP